MKRILGLWIALMTCVAISAQSAYISFSPYSQADRIGDLNGAGGVLILSKRNDLVITVVNAPSARVSAASMRADGYYVATLTASTGWPSPRPTTSVPL